MNNFFLRVSLQDKVIFSKHLSIMVKAGMPLLDSLTMLQKQSRSRSLSKILEQVVKDVSNGQFLSTGLEKYRKVFGDLFINIIRVGEASGILSENLNYLSEELKKKEELRRKVIGALIYPIIIAIATFGIIGLLTIFIFPKILPVFASLNVSLPATTKTLIVVSNFLVNHGGALVLWLALAVVAIFFVLRIPKVKFYYQRALLFLPIVGKMVLSVNMTNFSRTFGLLLKSGVKIVEALNITADTLPSLVYQKALKEAASKIQKGEQVSHYLLNYTHLFPVMLSNMIAVGENTGNLSETLLYLSDFYESEVGEMTKNLSNVLEPALMIIMGVLVGFVAISIITPIYQVTQHIGR